MAQPPLSLRVRIGGEPQPWQRAAYARRKRGENVYVAAFDQPETRSWKGTAKVAMQAAVYVATGGEAPPWAPDEPLEVHVLAVFSLPRGRYLKNVTRPRAWHVKHRGDADNLAKCVLDAGNGVLWHDDAQVVRLVVEKVVGAQGEAPRVEVRVARTRLEPERAGREPFAGVERLLVGRSQTEIEEGTR